MVRGSILIIGEDPHPVGELVRALRADGLEVEQSHDADGGLRLLIDRPFDIVVLDLKRPDAYAIELMRRTRAIRPRCEIVLVVGEETVDMARDALKRCVVDFIAKPMANSHLEPLIRGILEASPHESEHMDRPPLKRVTSDHEPFRVDEIVAKSDVMNDLLHKLPRIGRSGTTVLLLGETGTGKEIIANALHRLSRRGDRAFVKVNCAALPETLLEAELFGHVRGAYTGADSDRPGLFQVADGGTVFLDEIGELPLSLQPKLLRVLQEGEFHRVGEAGRTHQVSVRIIAATNRDLEAAVQRGAFRDDIYYRLNVVALPLPPLRERKNDLAPLIERFLDEMNPGVRPGFSAQAWQAVTSYGWPGNIRELHNAIEHALVMREGENIDVCDLPVAIQDHALSRATAEEVSEEAATLEALEIRSILNAMKKTGGNQTHAAGLLGISRRTLGYRIRKYDLAAEIDSLQPGRSVARVRTSSRNPARSA